MLKRTIAILLILVVSISIIWFVNPFSATTTVSANTYKSGFSIIPEKEDASGVLLDSGFLLSSLSDINLDYIKENVSFRSGEMFTIAATSDGKFKLKPTEPLIQNQVYFIDVKAPAGNIATFAFQTKRDFTVLGSLPENMSSYVPLDTGIELYFSYPDVKDISKYFEISPKVNGRFETNGYTSVFIPKGLKAETLYTVTIKKGLTAADGAVTLAEDYSFSFETSPDENSTADPYKGNLYINNNWIEFGTTETPVINFDIYLREMLNSVDVNLKLYRFETIDDFIKAIRKDEEAPFWAAIASSKNFIDTTKLEKVLEFKQSFSLLSWQQKYMMFPETLEHGYYLVELSSGELMDQTFLQISDISSYIISDSDKSLFWVNNIKTGTAVKGAEIFDYNLGKGFLTDSSGLVELPAPSEPMGRELFRVTTTDGQVSLVNNGYSYHLYPEGYYYVGYDYNPYNEKGLNWQYLQTDRSLYKPNDLVEFWGFIKSRINNESPEKVTVELARGGYYYPMRSIMIGHFFPSLSNALETIELDVKGGFYEGAIKLPELEPGSYSLTVKNGDDVISNSYINVENYIKPQYKLEISSDKNAIFVGEEIVFTIKASFFDGTPVANIPLNYYINAQSNNFNGNGTTDKNGTLTVKFTPKYSSGMQGEVYSGINVSAQFPETGEISEYYNFRTFANDINIQSYGKIVNGKGNIDITVNNIDLTTLNDNDFENDNYIGTPVGGQSLNITLTHITWEKIETGEVYDAINKVVRKTYEYREKQTPAGKAEIKTSIDGTAKYIFSVDPTEEGYYTAEVTALDANNRGLKHHVWISKYDNDIGYPQDVEYYRLKQDKESYRAGETVNVQVVSDKDVPFAAKTTLFVEARNGIQNYQIESKPSLTMAFPEAYAPNYYLNGIVFTGKGYMHTSATIVYDYEEKRIDLTVTTDKESYRPGENMTIKVEAKDINGNPVSGKVNISLVDEALLKLSGQYLDVLPNLYNWIGSGIVQSNSNRDAGIWNSSGIYGDMRVGSAVSKDAVMEEQAVAPSSAPMPEPGMGGTGSVNVRSEFKDTALFKTVTLNEDGLGSYTFKLPDNITSFSLASAAISKDLHAGSVIQSTKVSIPFFINDALSLDYLAGDKPYVGLTAYGDALEENEGITFELTIKELPDYKQTAEAKAFERVYLPLPTMTEGSYTVVIKAVTESGKADALSRTINVYSSYQTIEKAIRNDVVTGMKLEGGKSGLTTLVFTDAGRGSLINYLHSLSWDFGKRLDQKLVSNSARELLSEIIKNDLYYIDPVKVNPAEYKNSDGGYGILPYAGSDINFTALITPLLKDVMDTASLKMYLYDAVMSGKGVQAAALFALAELGEPVLLDLNRAAHIENLSLTEYVYLGMAFEAIGDYSKANEIYLARVAPELERMDPYIRVKVKKNDTDASYKQTALVAAFAARIDHPDATKLFNFVMNNYSKTEYVGVEQVLYLTEMAENLSDTDASIEYSFAGKTYNVDLSEGNSAVVKVPSINIGDLKISKVNGDVSVLSMFKGSFTENVKQETGVTLLRKYYDAATGEEKTNFDSDDLVKVVITYTIDETAIDNTYEISDYAPAGLKPLDNPWSYGVKDLTGCWYRQFDGQKVTFVVGKYDKKYPPNPLVYYARVASPGEYIAEGTIAQGSIVKSSVVSIGGTVLVINSK